MTVLMYNFGGDREIRIKNLCRKLNITYREVALDEQGRRLAYLLGDTDDTADTACEPFTDEMLVFADLYGMLDIFLAQLRRMKIVVPLKAVRTDTNVSFTSRELYDELCAERAAIARGMTAHE